MFSTNTSFLDLLSSFTPDPNSQPALPNDDTFGTFDECNSQYSDNNSESNSDIGDESDDGCEVAAQSHSQGVMDFMNDVGDASDEDADDKVRIDVWSELENKIRLGMQFENKKQVKNAVTLWSIANNREYKVLESKSHKWVAQCKSVHQNKTESSSTVGYTPNCAWYIRAVKKKNHHLWKITRWVDAHNCFGSCIGNNNRNLNSETIASYILHSIEKDVEYPVKSIQAYIKNKLNVDVSYWKAWHSRRKAIETLYGTWESNFDMLPEYIAALEASNPNTVVKWFHDPYSSANVVTFKYIF
ncbi:MULE transposase domain-containing protein [Tanacetum coccineum]